MPTNLRFDSPTFTLTWYLFRKFIGDLEYSTKEQEETKIRDFYMWCQEQGNLFDYEETVKLKEVYDIDDEAFELLEVMLNDPFIACSQLYVWWPLLVLSSRKPLNQTPVGVQLSVAVQFDDGHVASLPMPIGKQDEPYTDGMALTMWRAQLGQISDLIAAKGLDGLYAETCNKLENASTVEAVIPKRPGGLGF